MRFLFTEQFKNFLSFIFDEFFLATVGGTV